MTYQEAVAARKRIELEHSIRMSQVEAHHDIYDAELMRLNVELARAIYAEAHAER